MVARRFRPKSVSSKLVRIGRKGGKGHRSAKVALRCGLISLLKEHGGNISRSAVELGCATSTVRYWMCKLSVSVRREKKRSVVECSVREIGFRSVDLYFLDRADRLMSSMASELGVGVGTVTKAYKSFRYRMEEGGQLLDAPRERARL